MVSAEWLKHRLGAADLRVVDATLPLLGQPGHGLDFYNAGHIPGAVFFDINAIADLTTDLPHMLPTPEAFAAAAGALGLDAAATVVVYDAHGLWSAPRVWWMFRIMGARDVRLLEGGIDRWKREGRLVTARQTKVAPCLFEAVFDKTRVASLDDMRSVVASGSAQVADARPAGRFEGVDPEPRQGVRGGHMPGARNVPALSLGRDGALLPQDELRAAFEGAGIDLSKPVVTSCGSGVTAAVLTLALETLGHADTKLYDGSWTEWGGRPDTPVVKGKA